MIIDQLPLMSGNPQDDDEFPIERGTTTYKTKLQALAAGIFGKIASSATPLMDGAASPGTDTSAARADHRHPTDTTRAAAAELATYVRPNLLDNWYFVGGGSQLGYGTFPVNQRGQTNYSNAGHTIDRWRTDGSLTVNAGGISLNGTTLYQLLSATVAKKLLGKTVTASALFADGTLLSGTATFPTAISETSVIAYPRTNNELRYALVAGGSIQLLRFQMASHDADIVAAKVEIGSTQTLAHQENGVWVLNEIPDYEEQLLACQTSEPFYSTTGLSSTVGTIAAGGVTMFGRLAIVNIGIALTTSITGTTVVLNGLPLPLKASANYVAVTTNRQVTNNYVDGNGNVYINGTLESGAILMIACSYLIN